MPLLSSPLRPQPLPLFLAVLRCRCEIGVILVIFFPLLSEKLWLLSSLDVSPKVTCDFGVVRLLMILFVSVGLVELCLWTLVQLGSGGESWSYTECSTALRPEVEQLHVSSLSVVASLLLGVASSSSQSLFSLSLSVSEIGSMDCSLL